MHLIVRCISLIKRVSPAVEDTRYHRPITLNPPKHFKRHSDDDMLLSLFRDCRQIVCVEIKLSLWIYTRFIVCICPGEPYRCLIGFDGGCGNIHLALLHIGNIGWEKISVIVSHVGNLGRFTSLECQFLYITWGSTPTKCTVSQLFETCGQSHLFYLADAGESLSPISSKPSGKAIEVMFEFELEKARGPTVFSWLGSTSFPPPTCNGHKQNASLPIEVISSGSDTVVRFTW